MFAKILLILPIFVQGGQPLNSDLFLQTESLGELYYTQALIRIIKKIPDCSFDITVEADVSNRFLFGNIMNEVNELVSQLNSNTYQISVNRMGDKTNLHNVLFTDGYESFLEIYDDLEKHASSNAGKYVIVLYNDPEVDCYETMRRIMEKLHAKSISKVVMLIRTKSKAIDFYTFRPYTKDYCGEIHPERYNRFENLTLQKVGVFAKEKCSNFHKCPLKVFAWNIRPYMIFKIEATQANTTWNIFGLEGSILKTIAKSLNFSINLVTDYNYDWGEVYDYENMTGPFALLRNGEIDVHMGYVGYAVERLENFGVSRIYFSSKQVAVVKKHQITYQYDMWICEPFEWNTWMVMCCLYSALLALLAATTERGRKMENSLQFLSLLLGMPDRLRGRKLSYFLIIIAMYSSFVLRAVYQGKVYNSYSREHFKNVPKSLTDLFHRNYTFLSSRNFKDPLSGVTISRTKLNASDGYELFDRLYNSSENELVAASANHARIVRYIVKHNFRDVFFIIPEPINIHYYCAYFRKRSCLAENFSRIIELAVDSGLVSKWVLDYEMDIRQYQPFQEHALKYKEPMVLTIGKLRLVFSIFFGQCALSFLVFLGEVIYYYCWAKR